jgi:hypothetical protein
MHGKTLHYPELRTALFSSAISTNHRLLRNPLAGAGRPSSLLVVARRRIFSLRLSSANFVATEYVYLGKDVG